MDSEEITGVSNIVTGVGNRDQAECITLAMGIPHIGAAVRTENQRDKYIDGDRRPYRPIRPQTVRFYQSSYSDRREENTQRYRNSDDRSGRYSNKDNRMPYYKTDYSRDRNDTYYKAQSDSDSRHYSGERFDERELLLEE